MANSKVDVKLVLLGAADAGKTTLVERYLHKRFVESPQATIGAAFNAKRVTIDDERCVLGIWDTAGSERYESMSRIYYRAAKAALVCFDVRSQSGFARAQEWIKELQEQEPECALYLVGCKIDTVSSADERVEAAAIRAYAAKVGAKLFETSSKTGANVDALFLAVAENWLEQRKNAADSVDAGKKGVDLRNGQQNSSNCPC